MPQWCFAVPILPGKEIEPHHLAEAIHDRYDEYVASRRRAGVTLERIYEFATPARTFNVIYGEGAGYGYTMMALQTSELEFDRWTMDAIAGFTGIDVATMPIPPEPDQLIAYADPSAVGRRHGLAFTAPVEPQAVDAILAFGRQVQGPRNAEMLASRREKHVTMERAFLNHTPAGPNLCVYIEADDAALANKMFAMSESPFDSWFKEEAGALLGLDLSLTLPPIYTLHEWHEQ